MYAHDKLTPARPLVMGVLNVTPDSFSDGGCWADAESAIAHGRELVRQGADLIDVGGESTRPGATPIGDAEEIARVVPVIEALGETVRVSIDTRHEVVARAAVRAGATLINDISASLGNVAADCGVGWVAMHMQGDPLTMQQQPTYTDVVDEVRSYLVERAEAARANGVSEVWIDPGIGFGKTLDHNLDLLAHTKALVATGFPVLIGASRKTFLGTLTAAGGDVPSPEDRQEASLAAAVWAMTMGAGMIRVHDVQATVRAAQVVAALRQKTDIEEQAA